MIGTRLPDTARDRLDVILTSGGRRRWTILVCGSCTSLLPGQTATSPPGTCATCKADLFRNPDLRRLVTVEAAQTTGLERIAGGRVEDRIPENATLTERMAAELRRRLPDGSLITVDWTEDGCLRWHGVAAGRPFTWMLDRVALTTAPNVHVLVAQNASATAKAIDRANQGLSA